MDYIASFKSLHTDRKFNVDSPHKAILLLTVLDMYEKNLLVENEIRYNEQLIQCFQDMWDRALPEETLFHSNAYLPYWHLQSDGFWHIVPVRGKEDVVDSYRKDHIKPSETKIKECVKYAYLDEDLYFLMTLPSGRASLKKALLEKYINLPDKEIQKWVAPVDNTIDYSASAIEEYSNLAKTKEIASGVNATMGVSEDNILNELSEDVFITLHYHFFSYLKNHRFERTIFKEVIPSVAELYRAIINHGIAFKSLPASYSYAIDGFLKELRIAMMNEFDVDELIAGIDASIEVLNGIDYSNGSTSISDEELFEDIDEEKFEYSESEINSNIEREHQEEKNDIYGTENEGDNEAEQKIEKYSPVDFFVENGLNRGIVYDLDGNEQLKVDGLLKVIRGKLYRFNYKPMCLTVKGMYKTATGWEKGGKLLVPYSDSELYRRLDSHDFINYVEDFVECESFQDNMIKFCGEWYDFDGHRNKRYRPSSIYEGMEDYSVDEGGQYESTVSSSFLKNNAEILANSGNETANYLWVLAIVSLIQENENGLIMSFDELACMMISCAWEIFAEHPELKQKNELLSECIDYIIDESEKYMDVTLTKESSKEDVYAAIKDYPMSGCFEDAVDELTETAPQDVLKMWFVGDEEEDIVKHSVNFHRSCLYALHMKRFEPNIVVNPSWEHVLYAFKDEISEYFKGLLITSID